MASIAARASGLSDWRARCFNENRARNLTGSGVASVHRVVRKLEIIEPLVDVAAASEPDAILGKLGAIVAAYDFVAKKHGLERIGNAIYAVTLDKFYGGVLVIVISKGGEHRALDTGSI